jgi:hypothetical protein
MEWKKRNIRNAHIYCTELDEKNIESMLAECKIPDARGILSCDFEGKILRFSPSKSMTWGVVWYIQNLMIMQRLSQVDAAIDMLKKRGVI